MGENNSQTKILKFEPLTTIASNLADHHAKIDKFHFSNYSSPEMSYHFLIKVLEKLIISKLGSSSIHHIIFKSRKFKFISLRDKR